MTVNEVIAKYPDKVLPACGMPQGSEIWHAFRKLGIGGSEAASIIGANPWQTAHDLWEFKTGKRPPVEMNDAMRRGHELEPVARAAYTEETGNPVEPVCLIHPKYDWMRASLDGLTADGQIVVEIKCPGIRTHRKALSGEVPPQYYPQLQHQLAVAGALFGAVQNDYYSFFPVDPIFNFGDAGSGGVLITVKPDKAYIARLIEREEMFFDYVKRDIPPPDGVFDAPDEDVVCERNDSAWIEAANDYRILRVAYDNAKAGEEAGRKRLEELASINKASRVVGYGVSVSRIKRIGSIDYTAIPQLVGVDLDKYRKSPTSFMRVTYEQAEGE